MNFDHPTVRANCRPADRRSRPRQQPGFAAALARGDQPWFGERGGQLAVSGPEWHVGGVDLSLTCATPRRGGIPAQRGAALPKAKLS